MNENIYIENFERTECSDYFHGVIGRSLIIATRFDSSCINLATAIDLKFSNIVANISNEEFDSFVDKITSKKRTLYNSINSLNLPNSISKCLHDARDARNVIAHSLARGLDGCLDTKINAIKFVEEIKNNIITITEGDIIISKLMSDFNHENSPNIEYLRKYINEVVEWVIAE